DVLGLAATASWDYAVEDVIAARQALMVAIEELMQPIDTYTVDDSVDPDLMRANASAISAMLLSVPHLFPASSNRYDSADDYPETLALPAVWESFPVFFQMAGSASDAARRLTEISDADELRTASLSLRATCDACHATYLLPYEPAGVTQEDLDFDFDSIFENQ
ncbi:MAG: cytochrome c, partial [Gammaproteobacteria bacterium]